jgi:glycosyltransferase involved in cell wall biosynthesis
MVDNLYPPPADIYILHCFSKHNEQFTNWQKPKGAKVISIIHSDKNCFPASCSDKVIFLTSKHREKYKTTVPDEKAFVINGGIDTFYFNDPMKDYKKIVIGRICRSVPGKFHPRYFELCAKMKAKYGAEIKIITPDPDKIGRPAGVQFESVPMADREAKRKALSEITIGLWANDDFVDVFPLEVLELESMGIPVVAWMKNQEAAREMFPGLAYDSWEQIEACVDELCKSESMRKEQGRISREKAVKYDKRKMVQLYNKIMEVLK